MISVAHYHSFNALISNLVAGSDLRDLLRLDIMLLFALINVCSFYSYASIIWSFLVLRFIVIVMCVLYALQFHSDSGILHFR